MMAIYEFLRFRCDEGKLIKTPSRKLIESMDIDEYLNRVVDHKMIYHENYKHLLEVYRGDVPNDVVTRFKLNPLCDLVLENLNTHDSNLFLKKMFEFFPSLRNSVETSFSKGDIRFIEIRIPFNFWNKFSIDKHLKSDKFKNFVDFFGYIISNVIKEGGKYVVWFEPKFTENANDKVYGECHGFIYHVTTITNAVDILKSGLRMKNCGREMRYREFPKRVYFHAFPPYKNNILRNKDNVDKILQFAHDFNQIAIFKVDVNELNINFYKDKASESNDEDDAVFAYCNIPPERLELIYDGDVESILSYYLKYGD